MSRYIDADKVKEILFNCDMSENEYDIALAEVYKNCEEDVEPKIYGNEHNCIMTIFGECSYSETGCGSCAVVEKVRNALKGECPPAEPIRHGKWEEYQHEQHVGITGRCTICKGSTLYAVSYDLQGKRHTMAYCPNCGAKMDKE